MLYSLNTPEITRLALVIGALVAIAYKDKYNINPGGVTVPGLIITSFILSPIWCLSILALSFITYFVYKRWLEKAEYKRRTPMYILSFISLTLAYGIALIYFQLGWLTPSLDKLTGTFIPAIISFTWTNQKMSKVNQGITLTTITTAMILLFIYSLGNYVLDLDFDTVSSLYIGQEIIEPKYLLIPSYLMLTVGYLIYRHTLIRPGGYLIAPVAASLLIRPLSGIIFLFGCILVYFLTKFVCHITLVIGLNRYTLALLLSTFYVWSVEILFLHLDSTILPLAGSNIFVIITIVSYVNDAIIYEKKGGIAYMIFTLAIAIIILLLTEISSLIFI